MTDVRDEQPSARSLKDAFGRAWAAAGRDNVSILAAGVAYYAFLAFVPLLAAAVLTYGLVVDPETVARHIAGLAESLPESAAELIGGQLQSVVETSAGKKGVGLLLAIAIALFGARNGAGAVVTAVGLAYGESDERSFVRSTLLALAITLGAIVAGGLTVATLAVVAGLGALLPALGGVASLLIKALTYLVLLAIGIGGAGLLYRYAPDMHKPGWHEVRRGAVFTGAGWVLLTVLFGLYVANFGNYNATYGSLGAVVVLLTWLYLSAYLLLFGAELNATRGNAISARRSPA